MREDEIAGLKGENVDKVQKLLHITGKDGRYRAIPIPDFLLDQLNCSKQYLFTPSASWRASFRRTVRDATRAIGIEISCAHRLRANFVQSKYQDFIVQGMDEKEARGQISELLGHARIDVTYKYVPEGFKVGKNC